MLRERLKLKVVLNLRENFIQKDAQIWTIGLAEYSRFLAKEVWVSLNDYTEVTLIIFGVTLEEWKALPQADLQTIKDKFIQALREFYLVVESAKYQVRKFPHCWVKDYSRLQELGLNSRQAFATVTNEAIASKNYRNPT